MENNINNKRVGIVICYFGLLPNYYDLWEQSCGYNPSFDFILLTDNKIESKYENVIIVQSSLEEIKQRLEKALNHKVALDISYKLCDYKPLYGIAFEDMLRDYEFWGMCDMDMVFGDLSVFITDEVLNNYDKIFQLGHLTLYRNTDYINWSFKAPGWVSWEEVVQSNYHKRFCERGMIAKHAGIPEIKVYNPYVYIDVSKIHMRYMRSRFLTKWYQKRNYRFQVFYWENGKLFRSALIHWKIRTNEFAYIHFQKRDIKEHSVPIGMPFYISKNSFFVKTTAHPDVFEIYKMNPFYGSIYELYEEAIYGRKKKKQAEIRNSMIKEIEQNRKGI